MSSVQNKKEPKVVPEEESLNVELIYWEEFMLSLQEFYQAWDRFKKNPSCPVQNRIS